MKMKILKDWQNFQKLNEDDDDHAITMDAPTSTTLSKDIESDKIKEITTEAIKNTSAKIDKLTHLAIISQDELKDFINDDNLKKSANQETIDHYDTMRKELARKYGHPSKKLVITKDMERPELFKYKEEEGGIGNLIKYFRYTWVKNILKNSELTFISNSLLTDGLMETYKNSWDHEYGIFSFIYQASKMIAKDKNALVKKNGIYVINEDVVKHKIKSLLTYEPNNMTPTYTCVNYKQFDEILDILKKKLEHSKEKDSKKSEKGGLFKKLKNKLKNLSPLE